MKKKEIEKKLCNLLEKANNQLEQAYSKKKFDPDMDSTLFQDCVLDYKNIMNLIEPYQKSNTRSDLLTYYYLSAWLYHIQSSFNGLPENPSNKNKDIVSSNETEIEKLKQSLDRLKSQIENKNIFNEKNVDHSLKNNFNTLCSQINNYSNGWEKSAAHRKAVYCYNSGISLLEDNATSEKFQDFKDFPDLLNQIKENNLNTAIVCFKFSEFYYKEAGRTEDAASILTHKTKAKKKLTQLKKSSSDTLKRKESAAKLEKFFATNTASKLSDSSAPVAEKNQIEPHNNKLNNLSSSVPAKKRKNEGLLDEQEPASKKLYISSEKKVTINASSKPEEKITEQNIEKLTINTSSQPSSFSNQVAQKNQLKAPHHNKLANLPSSVPPKKRKNWQEISDKEQSASKKSYIAPELITTSVLLATKSEEEMLERRLEQYKEILNQISIDNPYRFYSRLFFDLSTQLKPHSKESSNHTLLTQLSWSTIAKQLIHLASNEINNKYFAHIENAINSLSATHYKALTSISMQKRAAAYPTYEGSDLQPKNLSCFFIKEIADYSYGLDAFGLSLEAKSFLDLIPKVINANSGNMHSIENAIQSVIKNTPNEATKNLFYANLLRELVKFHICKENLDWKKNTFSPGSEKELAKEYLRILTVSNYLAKLSGAAGQEFQNKIEQLVNHLKQELTSAGPIQYSTQDFFQAPQQNKPLATDLLIRTLREHIQCLIKYRADSIAKQTIHSHLLNFITTSCAQEKIHISPLAPQGHNGMFHLNRR